LFDIKLDCNKKKKSYHDSGVFPLGELVEDPEEVDAAEAVPPAVGRGVADLQSLGGQLGLLTDHA
jgi:hypothetical protein